MLTVNMDLLEIINKSILSTFDHVSKGETKALTKTEALQFMMKPHSRLIELNNVYIVRTNDYSF